MKKRELYIILIIVCLAGYGWLFYHLAFSGSVSPECCLFRRVTHLPCPSCGSTRSVISILHGNFTESLHWNPLGWIVLSMMVMIPLLMIIDLITGKRLLYHLFIKTEKWLKKKIVFIPLIILLTVNWLRIIIQGI